MAQHNMRGIWQATKLREKLVIIIGVIYVVLPIDIIPEAFLGPLGLLDDGGAILAIIGALWAASNRYRSQNLTVIEGEEAQRH